MRDFTYIDDAVDGIIRAVEMSYPFEIFNLGKGQPDRVEDVISIIEDLLGKRINVEKRPMPLADILRTEADMTLALERLHYNPKVSLKEGVRRFLDWYVEYVKLLEGDV